MNGLRSKARAPRRRAPSPRTASARRPLIATSFVFRSSKPRVRATRRAERCAVQAASLSLSPGDAAGEGDRPGRRIAVEADDRVVAARGARRPRSRPGSRSPTLDHRARSRCRRALRLRGCVHSRRPTALRLAADAAARYARARRHRIAVEVHERVVVAGDRVDRGAVRADRDRLRQCARPAIGPAGVRRAAAARTARCGSRRSSLVDAVVEDASRRPRADAGAANTASRRQHQRSRSHPCSRGQPIAA